LQLLEEFYITHTLISVLFGYSQKYIFSRQTNVFLILVTWCLKLYKIKLYFNKEVL